MNITTEIEDFVDKLCFDHLYDAALKFGIEVVEPHTKDEWPTWEDELRMKLVEKIEKRLPRAYIERMCEACNTAIVQRAIKQLLRTLKKGQDK